MPTVAFIKGYRLFFYSNDHEHLHIHIEKDNKTAKYNLQPVELLKSKGFNASELKTIGIIIEKNLEQLKQKWYEYFNG